MIKHQNTLPAEVNFAKLEMRILKINDPNLGKFKDICQMIYEITTMKKPVLIVATGGSKVVAYYLAFVIEHKGKNICKVIEPRDYFYMENKESFSLLVAISASGNTNGIREILGAFKGEKYLICENEKDLDCKVIAWSNDYYDKEKSFISLASSLGVMALLLDATRSEEIEVEARKVKEVNDKIRKLIVKSKEKIDKLQINFKGVDLIQVISGYDTKAAEIVLESNLIEVGAEAVVCHDKGSYCHGRSNLLFQYPNSYVIYLAHQLKEIDNLIINSINEEYSNLLVIETFDLEEDIFLKEYYLILQLYFLSKRIAEDKNIDLTQPEYNVNIVRKVYNFRGEM